MTTAREAVEEMRREAAVKSAEAARLERLAAAYPDLRRHVGRWEKVAYCSKSVNGLVSHYEARHNCGCCPDSPLEVWPHVETEDGRVYSDPPCFRVGERHWVSGDRPTPGWKEELRGAGIPEPVIDSISARFRADREERLESLSGDEDDE